jgi:hypothetical protein
MTTATPDVLPHVDAVQAALEAAGLTVYLGGTPTSDGWTAPDKYAVLYPDPGTAVRESLADERTDFECTMQVTCVGSDVVRALWVAARVRRALSAPLDDQGRGPAFFVPVQYRICSTPA